MIAVLEYDSLPYREAERLQQQLVQSRKDARASDTLILLEHPPVITLGRNAHREHVLLAPGELARRGIDLVECNRGGDVTYHGPGQLVGYPIFDLRQLRRPAFMPVKGHEAANVRTIGLGPVDFVRALEEILIRTLAQFGLAAQRVNGLTGVWTRGADATSLEGQPQLRKLAAIGIHVSRGVTSHGFALNVTTPPEDFSAIVPCGIRDFGVTSIARELGEAAPAMPLVRNALLRQFGQVFSTQILRLDSPPPRLES